MEGMDHVSTPLEKRRRSEMKIRDVRYGFFRVGQKVDKVKCTTCKKDITGTSYYKVNGVSFCWDCTRGS